MHRPRESQGRERNSAGQNDGCWGLVKIKLRREWGGRAGNDAWDGVVGRVRWGRPGKVEGPFFRLCIKVFTNWCLVVGVLDKRGF